MPTETIDCLGDLKVGTDYSIQQAVIPYQLNKDLLPPDIVARIYDHFSGQNLLPELCHERATTRDEFVEFIEKQTIASIMVNLAQNRYAGIAWLSQIADLDSHTRAIGAYCFLREYWNRRDSMIYGKLCLSQWFFPREFGIDSDGLESLWGVTPEPNRLARLYSARLGFRYVAVLPGFTSYHGYRCNGLVCRLERSEFEDRWKLFDSSLT